MSSSPRRPALKSFNNSLRRSMSMGYAAEGRAESALRSKFFQSDFLNARNVGERTDLVEIGSGQIDDFGERLRLHQSRAQWARVRHALEVRGHHLARCDDTARLAVEARGLGDVAHQHGHTLARRGLREL